MNGKKGLSGIMSALLAVSSVIGGASADTKKKTKEPNGAAVVLRDIKNRGRDKGGNKRGEKLGLLSAESGVVGLIKEHPKTSAGLGFAVLGAICYGGYKGYKLWYDSEWHRYYRAVFNEENYGSRYLGLNAVTYVFSDGMLTYHEKEKNGLAFSCGADNTKQRSLLSAMAMSNFLRDCYLGVCKYLESVGVGSLPKVVFCSFSEIDNKFCEAFLEHSKKIKGIVKFYCGFAKEYKEKLVNELEKYAKKNKRKLVFTGGGVISLAAGLG